MPGSESATLRRGKDFFIPDLCAAPSVFFAVILAELVVLLHVLALAPLREFDWQSMAFGSLFVQWITLLCLALICRIRGALSEQSPLAATLYCLATVAAVTICTSIVLMGFATPDPFQIAGNGILLDLTVRNTILALLIAAIVLRYAYLQQRVAIQQRSELQLRLDALQARIRPHFLFNTLNSIASLIAVQPDRAEQAIEDVSELFRAALKGDRQGATLGDELRLCELYLAIEELRLESRLKVNWDVDAELSQEPLPALLLQPLVENAVYHGIAQIPSGGTVTISARQSAEKMLLRIENPTPEIKHHVEGKGHQMALENVRQRIAGEYGVDGSLILTSSDQHFVVEAYLPRRGKNDLS
ncbi:MAG: histidine kinase [Pseudomonadota bacterium]